MIGPRTKALLPVDLYGQPANLPAFENLADRYGIALIEDAAQSHLAALKGRPAGSFGDVACFSFYPGKNLGALGEAGAVVTDDGQLADRIRRLRDHAQDRRHHHTEVGYNYRMEGLQGVVLGVKLRHLQNWTDRRRAAAAKYGNLLSDVDGVTVPCVADGADPAWHLYVVRSENRDLLATELAADGIATAVHYPTPIHLQPAYAYLGHRRAAFPNAELFAATCLSLPMYAELSASAQEYIVDRVRAAMER
jgi:dTDP-4-amino-4,6-dideoxygalactose transaminase